MKARALRGPLCRGAALGAAVLWLWLPGSLTAQEASKVAASHEKLEPDSKVDEYGIFVPIPASHPSRRFPADEEFPSGPNVGERLPDFALPNQRGEMVDFHQDRGNAKAAVMFQRSAVW